MYETSLESQTKWSALVGLCELHFVDNLFNQPTNQISGDLWQVSFKKEVGVMVIDLVFWLTVCLILKMCY